MYLQRRAGTLPSPNIVSMIDVIFFIVIFFMVFSSFGVSHEGIMVDLPTSSTAQPVIDDSFVVTITLAGQMYFNDHHVDGTADLERKVKDAVTNNPSVLGIVQADEMVPYQAIIKVVDLMRMSGVKNVSLAASLELKQLM